MIFRPEFSKLRFGLTNFGAPLTVFSSLGAGNSNTGCRADGHIGRKGEGTQGDLCAGNQAGSQTLSPRESARAAAPAVPVVSTSLDASPLSPLSPFCPAGPSFPVKPSSPGSPFSPGVPMAPGSPGERRGSLACCARNSGTPLCKVVVRAFKVRQFQSPNT